MLSAVQIHNNPQVEFKAELFIVRWEVSPLGCCSVALDLGGICTVGKFA